MPLVQMRDLQNAARGAAFGGTGAPAHIMGMVSSVTSAMKTVHMTAPAAGSAQIHSKLAHYIQRAGSSNPGHRGTATAATNYAGTVDQCAAWHTASPLKAVRWQLKGVVTLTATDQIAGVVRVVLEDAAGDIVGRIVLWDTFALDPAAAELIAAPAVDILDQTYGAGRVASIEVWQCRLGVQHAVAPAAARAARSRLAALVAGM